MNGRTGGCCPPKWVVHTTSLFTSAAVSGAVVMCGGDFEYRSRLGRETVNCELMDKAT